MFGHNDNQAVVGAPQVQQPTAVQDPATMSPPPVMPQQPMTQTFGAPAGPDMSQPVFTMSTTDQSPAMAQPVSDPMPVFGASTAGPVQPPVDTVAPTTTTDQPVDHTQLADMKREALKHLEPLADHLDGTPEETFRATMMMIQANDNHTLLDKAFRAAKQIPDDKARAQALLDFINELNYFSQTSAE